MEEKKKKFRLFDMNRDGPGVSKDEGPLIPNFKNMPKFYFRHFTKLLSLDMLMLPLIVIPFALVYLYLISPTTPSQTSVLYSTIFGSHIMTNDPVWTSLLGVYGMQLDLHVFNTGFIITFAVLVLVMACLWGPINIGATYICRSLVRGEPVFVWSDFKYAVKRNFKQGFLFGLIDFAALFALGFDLWNYSQVGGSFWLDFLFFAIIGVIVLYLLMRFYIYLMIVTFDMKLRKILKNALIFSILGIWRNLMGTLGILVLIILNVLLIIAFWPLNIVVPVIFPVFYLLPSICAFKTYAAYPVIEKYMIKYEPTAGDDPDAEDNEEIPQV